MTIKEAREIIAETPFWDRFTEDEQKAMSMAERSLEAWEIVKAEIENDWMFKKYPSAPYTCGLRDALEIIDKHLKEVEE